MFSFLNRNDNHRPDNKQHNNQQNNQQNNQNHQQNKQQSLPQRGREVTPVTYVKGLSVRTLLVLFALIYFLLSNFTKLENNDAIVASVIIMVMFDYVLEGLGW